MHFMQSDEFLLLMNLGPNMLQGTHVLSASERARIRDAGIKTAIEYPEWGVMEPTQGIYNFACIEEILRMNRQAGMKTILAVPGPWIPHWIPDAWRYRYSDGVYNGSAISIWNRQALDYEQGFFRLLIERHCSDDVMFILNELDTGESVLPSYGFYDDCAKADFSNKFGDVPLAFDNEQTKQWLSDSAVRYFTETQAIFYQQFHEIWDAHQWLISHLNPASVNYAQPAILESYRKTFQDLCLVLLQYTYFDDKHPVENEAYVDMLKNTYDCEVIAEAMFCKGLPMTTPKAIGKGFRGQIICPMHPHTHEQSFKDEMVDAIRDSHRQWTRSKINENSGGLRV